MWALVVVAACGALYWWFYERVVCRPAEVWSGDAALGGVVRALPALRDFRPAPWCPGARLQTVLGSLLRGALLPPVSFTRQEVQLADGGRVALDWVAGGGARAVLLVLPGLTGGTRAEYVRCAAAAAAALGATAVVVNHRGRGAPLATPRLYSAVSHADLAQAAAAAAARAPARPLLAVGVSLGGLILARHLADAGARTPLAAALAVSAPLDAHRAADAAERLANAPLSWHMARQLRAAVREQPSLAGHHAAVGRARTLRQFDAAFTAGHFGFSSAEEYYSAATMRGRLARVAAPLLCVCAADDPLQPRAALPLAEAGRAPRVALAVTARGGHIGFLEAACWSRRAGDHFLSRLMFQYFDALLARPELLHAPQ